MKVRIITIALAGLLLAASFPRINVYPLIWIAFFPLILISARSHPLRALVYGFIYGEAFFITMLYWIYLVLNVHASLGIFLSVLILLLLTSYLSLYPSLFAFLISRAVNVYGDAAILLSPVIWVALEYVRGHLFSGFPWGLAGYALSSNTSMIQMASLTGVYGLSFLILLANASLAFLFIGKMSFRRATPLLVSLIIVLSFYGWGSWRVSVPLEGGRKIRVACIQGNYGGNTNSGVDEGIVLSDYLQMTKKAAREGIRLIVWPESTTFFEVCGTTGYADLLKELCSGFDIDLVLGSIHRAEEGDEEIYFNSAFHIRNDGEIDRRYDKIHLVPYGEYVPIPKILFFVKRFVQAAGDFSRGSEFTLMDYGGDPFSVLICYEVIFPEFVQQFNERGPTFYVNITNDAWFGSTAAPYQHFDFLKLRAVECGRYFVRSASTGISGIISPRGDVLKSTGIFSREIMECEIQTMSHSTFYSRAGHWFPVPCAIMTFVFILSLFFSSWGQVERGAMPEDQAGMEGESRME
ncbi:MAG: apolipoprotein N-acyltransferase [Acidobacteriota bacterium]